MKQYTSHNRSIQRVSQLGKLLTFVSCSLLVLLVACGGSEDIVFGGAPETDVVADGESSVEDSVSEDAVEPVVESMPSVSEATGVSSVSELRINTFLWKPVSEGDGNLVILVDPVDVDVLVTGAVSENLVDFGPSNDRGTTARGSFPGCNYGRNVLVEFFELATGRRILIADGSDSVRIDDGCNRVEF